MAAVEPLFEVVSARPLPAGTGWDPTDAGLRAVAIEVRVGGHWDLDDVECFVHGTKTRCPGFGDDLPLDDYEWDIGKKVVRGFLIATVNPDTKALTLQYQIPEPLVEKVVIDWAKPWPPFGGRALQKDEYVGIAWARDGGTHAVRLAGMPRGVPFASVVGVKFAKVPADLKDGSFVFFKKGAVANDGTWTAVDAALGK